MEDSDSGVPPSLFLEVEGVGDLGEGFDGDHGARESVATAGGMQDYVGEVVVEFQAKLDATFGVDEADRSVGESRVTVVEEASAQGAELRAAAAPAPCAARPAPGPACPHGTAGGLTGF